MLVAYSSMTGNVKRFVNQLPFPTVDFRQVERIDQPYVLVTYTFHFGKAPAEVDAFLKRHPQNRKYLTSVAASGNRNWGSNFAKAADEIASKYHVPILHKFELAGTQEDIQIMIRKVREIEYVSRNQCPNGCAV